MHLCPPPLPRALRLLAGGGLRAALDRRLSAARAGLGVFGLMRSCWQYGSFPELIDTKPPLDYRKANGGDNGELKGGPQNLAQGDEVVTRRYEFYEYVGPLDPETGEALAQSVGPDGVHGDTNSIYADTVVVGQFLGAQMSAFDVGPPLGLIDHLPDGMVNAPYPTRSVVIAVDTNFTVTTTGALPDGMAFDPATGQVYGTPWTNGVFTFRVEAAASNSPAVAKTYLFSIAPDGEVLPPHSAVDTSEEPVSGGTATGSGVYANDTIATVTARPAAGYALVNWTDNGTPVSTAATYSFTVQVHRSLVAHFVPAPTLGWSAPQPNALTLAWPTNFTGFVLQQNLDLMTTNWMKVTNAVQVVGTDHQVSLSPPASRGFFRLVQP